MLNKSLRFYGSSREDEILEALSRHREYGYDTERQMIMDALYQMVQSHENKNHKGSAPSVGFNTDTFMDQLTDRLISRIKAETMLITNQAVLTESDCIPAPDAILSGNANEDDLNDALDFIDALS